MKNLLDGMSPEERKKKVAKQIDRLQKSAKYYDIYFENWKIYYKMYYALKDDSADTDEPNMLVPVAYGIVEDAIARTVVPLLQKLPISVRAKATKYAANAEKFYYAARDYFGSDDYRIDRIASEREYVITGNAWEVYEWRNDVLHGKKWANVDSEEPVEYQNRFMGKVLQTVKSVLNINKPQEVDQDYPLKVGFTTRFPSSFSMFPEPGVKKFENVSWVVEVEGIVSLADLEKATYIDPDTRQSRPLYDLTELLASVQGDRKKIKPDVVSGYKQGDDISQIISGRDPNVQSDSDEPSVFIIRVYQKDNTILTVAQGKFLIQAITEVYHYPVMPIQLRVYTQDKENLFGKGIIEPIMDLLYEVNDIHNMSFQNWIRTINKMIVYDEGVIKYPDDFTPQAGGKIRANLLAGGNVNNAFGVVDHPDVSGSMISMESQTMGKIERTISITDLTPGVQGTKAYHKTYGGLMEIQSSFARRFSIMAMMGLSYMTKQMRIMYWMYQQFMFDDMPVGAFKEGKFMAETYRREDFDSGGQGFIFVQSNDPSFGDAAVQRNQFMVLFEQVMKYEQFRMTMKDPELDRAAVDKVLKMLLEAFGMQDTSVYLAPASGTLTPQQEFDMILQGIAPKVNPKENFMEHLIEHVTQRRDPGMLDAIAGGKMPPEVMTMLDQHIKDTMDMIQLFMENIDKISVAKVAEKNMGTPEYRQGGQGAGLGMGMGSQPAAPRAGLGQNVAAGAGGGMAGGPSGGNI